MNGILIPIRSLPFGLLYERRHVEKSLAVPINEQQAHSMIPTIERYPDTLKQVLTRQRQNVTRMTTAEKAVKDRNCTQMPVANKERTDHKCLWQREKDQTTNACGKKRKNRPQKPVTKKERPNHKCLWQRKKDQTTNAGSKRKMAVLTRQANSWHQMKETKKLKPPKKTRRWPTCKHNLGEKTPPNGNSLIDYCLQQMSGRMQSKLEEHRAKITVPTTNRWRAKLTITNLNQP